MYSLISTSEKERLAYIAEIEKNAVKSKKVSFFKITETARLPGSEK